MSRGEQPGFQVNIPEVKAKDVQSGYERHLEQNSKASAKMINGELVSYGVVNKAFSNKPFIVYTKFLETVEGVVMTVFITEDSLNFLNDKSESDKVEVAKKTIHDFAADQYRKAVGRRLDHEKDKLKDMKGDLESMISHESSNMKSISSRQREIENDKLKIEQNKSAQVAKADQVASQQRMIDNIGNKESPEYVLATKNLKTYQNDKRSLEKTAEKLGRNIDNNNEDIREYEHKNEELKRQQEDMKIKIGQQEKYVSTVETELNGIR